MGKLLSKIKSFFQSSEFPPEGEYPEEDRRREFCIKTKNCSFYGTKGCPLFS